MHININIKSNALATKTVPPGMILDIYIEYNKAFITI